MRWAGTVPGRNSPTVEATDGRSRLERGVFLWLAQGNITFSTLLEKPDNKYAYKDVRLKGTVFACKDFTAKLSHPDPSVERWGAFELEGAPIAYGKDMDRSAWNPRTLRRCSSKELSTRRKTTVRRARARSFGAPKECCRRTRTVQVGHTGRKPGSSGVWQNVVEGDGVRERVGSRPLNTPRASQWGSLSAGAGCLHNPRLAPRAPCSAWTNSE